MKLIEHVEHTKKLYGIEAEDIHKWIDGLFDSESFDLFLRTGRSPDFNPYDHRKHRHCLEALEDAYREFEGKYTREQIKNVFDTHIKDDYDGYIPHQIDFENGTFEEKYHEAETYISKEKILSRTELIDYFQDKKYAHAQGPTDNPTQGFLLRIVLPTILAIILFISSIFIIIVPVFHNTMMARKKEMIKELTYSAVSVAEYYIGQEKRGVISRKQAQAKAAFEIGKMRYGADRKDYFWVTNMEPRMVMHPYRTELIGKNLTNYRDREDKSGKLLFVEFVDVVKSQKSGYVEYLWQWKDDQTRTAPKLSYVQGIPEWGWIVGTGVYIDDVEAEMNRLIRDMLVVFGVISLVLIFILLSIMLYSRRIENNRQWAETGLREAKDRYRALVEASNEGYILEVDGETIYSNHTLQRMLEYSEEELAAIPVWDLVEHEHGIEENEWAIDNLKRLYAGQSTSSDFEAQIKSKSGTILEVVISTSRIFFSHKNGHVISFRLIRHQPIDRMLDTYSMNSTNWFVFKPVRDVLRPYEDGETPGDSQQTTIEEDISVMDALVVLEKSGESSLTVLDGDQVPVGTISYTEIAHLSGGLPVEILMEISNSDNVGHVIRVLNRLPSVIREMTHLGVSPDTMRHTIGKVYDAAIEKFIHLSIQELGEPPVRFAFLSLGSNARYEMTLFSDQDNALVFEEVPETELESVRTYFLELGKLVCTKLDQAGYPLCPGGIMAMNPKYCLSVTEWKGNFANWILNATQEAILEVNVFFDIHCSYGEYSLVEELKSFVVTKTEENPEFFIHFAKNCLMYKVPLSLLGHIKTETKDGKKTINIKYTLKPIEILVRIYALKSGIMSPGTLSRARELAEQEIFEDRNFREIEYVFNYLWRQRFYNQIIAHMNLKEVNDELEVEKLTEPERKNLENVLSQVTLFQTKLSFDFLGTSTP